MVPFFLDSFSWPVFLDSLFLDYFFLVLPIWTFGLFLRGLFFL
jgi:hypothetical protein